MIIYNDKYPELLRRGVRMNNLIEFGVRCLEMDKEGNTGTYNFWQGVESLRWLQKRWAKPYRDGIVFYSTGWGWRLRRNPEWESVFDERFPLVLEFAHARLRERDTAYSVDCIPF